MIEKKEINLKDLMNLENELLQCNDFITSQNALVNNDLLEILQDKDIIKRNNEDFTNNIRNESAKIVDQKQSGRC